jgi:hypothetical protein
MTYYSITTFSLFLESVDRSPDGEGEFVKGNS